MLVRHLSFLICSLYLIGCGSSSLRVTSTPEGAEVFVVNKDRAISKLGVTPIDLDEKNSAELLQNSSQIQVTKEGYLPQSAVTPKLTSLGGNGRIHFNLQDTVLPKVCQVQGEAFNEIAKGVAEITNLMQRKRYDEAGILTKNYIGKFSTVSVFHDLLGNIYYLQKDLTQALSSYKKSVQLLPNNPQTVNMIEKIEKIQTPQVGG